MVSALYLRMSFLDNRIPHLIAERFPGKATSINLIYITKRETEREQLPFGAQIPATKYKMSYFGGLELACWPLVPRFAGSHPAEAVGFLGRKKSSARLPSEGT